MNAPARSIGLLWVFLAVTACTTTASPTPSASTGATTAPGQLESRAPAVSPVPSALGLTQARSATPIRGAGTIHSISNMAVDRAAHTATQLPNGMVLIAGGFGGRNDTYYDSAELYDPATQTFAPTGAMSAKRCCHTATLLPSGKVLIAGGFDGDYLSSAEIYDPATGRFTPTGRMTTARDEHIAVLLQNGKVLLAGGVGTGWTFLASAELYDPATGEFTPTGSMTAPREGHTMTVLHDGRVLVAGGHRGRHSAITIYASAELYDPATGLFALTGNMTVKRHKHDAVLLPNGRVLISGGSDERDDLDAYTSTEQYDPATGTFSASADMPSARYKHQGTSVVLKNGMVLIAGGAKTAVLYDPLTNAFRTVAGDVGTARLSRLFATATLLPSDQVLIAGGYGLNQSTSAGAWLYKP